MGLPACLRVLANAFPVTLLLSCCLDPPAALLAGVDLTASLPFKVAADMAAPAEESDRDEAMGGVVVGWVVGGGINASQMGRESSLCLLQFLARKCGEHTAHSLATHSQHPAPKSVLCTEKRNGASGCTKRRDTATGKSGEAARTKGVVVREGDVMLWVRAACCCCPSWITGATRHPKHPGLNCRKQTRQPGLVPSTGSRCDDCRWTGIDTQPAV